MQTAITHAHAPGRCDNLAPRHATVGGFVAAPHDGLLWGITAPTPRHSYPDARTPYGRRGVLPKPDPFSPTTRALERMQLDSMCTRPSPEFRV